jgi:hypothetical protein
MNNLLEFDFSPWFILLCLALGSGYSYLQYQKKAPWSININRFLAISRAILVSILAVLLLGPTVRAIKNFFEKPLMVMAIDNSESIALTTDSTSLNDLKVQLGQLSDNLTANGWQVELVGLTGEDLILDSLKYNIQRSNLTGMVQSIQSEYEGANLSGILVVSDGIFNSGFSPDLISTFTPFYSVGLGDTIPREDLSIINVLHNKTVYQDNLYPVEVSIRNERLGPDKKKLSIYQGNTLLDQVQLDILPDVRLITHRFLLKATNPGKQRVTIILESVPGEETLVNNRTSFYIDVIEGQQKVLIVADAPSPEIKALRLAIEQNEHFIVDVMVAGEIPDLDYDLVIIAQSPNRGINRSVYQQLASSDIPKLYLIGSPTDLRQLNRDGVISFQQANNQYDHVTALINDDYKGFTISPDMAEWLAQAPPITVPFGNVVLQPTDQVLLYQRIGTVDTKRPIIYFSDGEQKKGMIIADGLWKWRLNEYKKYGTTTRFDELVTKTIMLLASKPDNRQFKLYPLKDGYEVGEDIIFVSETFNELFEPLYGEPVNLKITFADDSRNYAFTPLSGSQQMRVDDLPGGLYNYSAYTTLNGKRHQVSGQFSVEKPDLEAADLTADHLVLRKLAMESGGKFYNIDELADLKIDFSEIAAPAIIHTQEKELLLLNLYWILIALIILVSVEWLTRKMMGGY